MKDPLVRLEALLSMKNILIKALQADNEQLKRKVYDLEAANEALSAQLIETQPLWWKHQDATLTGDNND